MRTTGLASLLPRVSEAAAELAWAQWSALGSLASSTRRVRALVDPEPLVALSVAIERDERRVRKLLAWWAHSGSRQLSVQRMSNLLPDYPASVAEGVARFAAAAVSQGKDARWRKLAGDVSPWRSRERNITAPPALNAPQALMLRLRVGLGVGIKADVLTFLLGRAGARATVQEIAEATCYYPRAVRRAVEDLAAARFIQSVATSPVSYRVDEEPWTQTLGLADGPPQWGYWHQAYAFLTHLKEWLATDGKKGSRFVRASQARDLMERHARVFEQQGVRLSVQLDDARGEAYLEPFADAVGSLLEQLVAFV